MGKKAPMWAPSKKELEKILEVDNVHELFLVGQVCIERMLEKILEKKFNYHGYHSVLMLEYTAI